MADPTKAEGSVEIPKTAFTITSQPIQTERYIKIMVYGDYGTGKSTLAGTSVDVSQMRDVLLIDAESGEMAYDENPRIENSGLIDRIRVTDFKSVAKVQQFLKAHCHHRDLGNTEKLLELERMVKPGVEITEPKQYRTIIIDSLTEINEFCMYQLLGLSTGMELDPETMDVAEWGEFRKNNQMMQLLIRAYRDLPMNVILICSSAYTQDELKRKAFAPNITGKLSLQVQGFMDVVGYLMSGKIAEGNEQAPRRLYVQPVGNFAAKNRRAIFKGAHFDDPTMGQIMSALKLISE